VPQHLGGDPNAEVDPVFPFCSRRCQLIDLGRWLDGDYRVVDESAEGYGEVPPTSDGDS